MAQKNVNKNYLTDFIDVESLNFFRNAESVTRRKVQKQTNTVFPRPYLSLKSLIEKNEIEMFLVFLQDKDIICYASMSFLELIALVWCKGYAKMISFFVLRMDLPNDEPIKFGQIFGK